MARRFEHTFGLLRLPELILVGLFLPLFGMAWLAHEPDDYSWLVFILAICDAIFWLPFCLVCQYLIRKLENPLKRHAELTVFALVLLLAVFTLASINAEAIVRSQAFYDWAQERAPSWWDRPFLHYGSFWVDELEEAVTLYFVTPSLFIVCPCLIIANLLLSRKLRSWGKANLGLFAAFFTVLLGLGALFWTASFYRRLGEPREKPVIYLYPQTEQTVNVRVNYPGAILHAYPAYPSDGWTVLAKPGGELVDLKTGRKHYCLFWEGRDAAQYDLGTGFVVEGRNTAKFLEEKLAALGLSEREANEFIIYWLPRMENNRYNVIHFATEEYNKRVPLEITPPPDTLIRVLMLYKAAERPPEIQPQPLTPAVRKGFTVVEWGGTEVK